MTFQWPTENENMNLMMSNSVFVCVRDDSRECVEVLEPGELRWLSSNLSFSDSCVIKDSVLVLVPKR